MHMRILGYLAAMGAALELLANVGSYFDAAKPLVGPMFLGLVPPMIIVLFAFVFSAANYQQEHRDELTGPVQFWRVLLSPAPLWSLAIVAGLAVYAVATFIAFLSTLSVLSDTDVVRLFSATCSVFYAVASVYFSFGERRLDVSRNY